MGSEFDLIPPRHVEGWYGVVHAVYYLAFVLGYPVYSDWRCRLGVGVWSPSLAGDLEAGVVRRLPVEAAEAVARLLAPLAARLGVGAARLLAELHWVATRVYPPVDDPVEYVTLLHPLLDGELVAEAWRRLREAKLIK